MTILLTSDRVRRFAGNDNPADQQARDPKRRPSRQGLPTWLRAAVAGVLLLVVAGGGGAWWRRQPTPNREAPAPRTPEDVTVAEHLRAFESGSSRYRAVNQQVWRTSYATATVGQSGWLCPEGGGTGGAALAALTAWRVWLAGLAVEPAPDRTPPDGPRTRETNRVELRSLLLEHRTQFMRELDQGDPEEALLAVRAARRAVRRNPEDPDNHLLLYQAYRTQSDLTRERTWRTQLPALDSLRQMQMIDALHTVIRLREDSRAAGVAHGHLAGLYLEPQLFLLDLSLQHRKEQLRLARRHGLLPPETPQAFEKRVAELEGTIEPLEKDVGKRKVRFAAGSTAKERVLYRAMGAQALGLGEEALQTLLQSNAVEFGPEGARREINLLLLTGRAEDARRMLNDKDVAEEFAKGTLGKLLVGDAVLPAYPWFLLVLAELAGEDAEADRRLAELCQAVKPPGPTNLTAVLGQAILDAPPRADANRILLSYLRCRRLVANAAETELLRGVMTVRGVWPAPNQDPLVDLQVLQYALFQRRHANLLVVRGILALDRGDTKTARASFEAALQVATSPDQSGPVVDSFVKPARHYLRLLGRSN